MGCPPFLRQLKKYLRQIVIILIYIEFNAYFLTY
nr:MAG TPA: Protein trafficking PGA2 [Caudoviricetes sp.]